ncbi:PCF11P-similar protein 4 [Hibiscus syriacus]|uniref:RNA-directed DNA polymerase n=1 Tax=Hibiscus syriacus TaxID=106335 RepID=A0A6A3BLT2_HIBSY|nr:PCF11P-similar protein 4 [Hibiscus syriacus]
MDAKLDQLKKEMQEDLLRIQQEWQAKMDQSQKSIIDQILQSQANMMKEMMTKSSGLRPEIVKEPSTAPVEVSRQESTPRLVISPEKLVEHPAGSSAVKVQMATTNPPYEYIDVDPEEMEKPKMEVPEHLKDWCKGFFKEMGKQGSQDGMNAEELSLVPDLVLPPKFKMPEFEKYDGKTCPVAHMTMFCRRMTGFVKDNGLLIHCFQASLTGSAVRWYNQLTRAKIGSWKDLANAFKEQYQHVTDMMPDRVTLQNMEMKHNETFRQYAQRWRDIAAQVHPPLIEREFITMFIDTLKSPYIDHMLGVATKSFSDIVMCGEMIKRALKKGQIVGSQTPVKKPYVKRKEGEVNNVNFSVNKPKMGNSFSSQGETKHEHNNERMTFTPIPMTYSELFHGLVQAHVVSPKFIDPIKPLYPKWFNENETCEYHANLRGHNIEKCLTFKRVVEDLIKRKVVSFNDSEAPCVAANPLPNHQNQGVNAIEKNQRIKRRIKEVRTPLKWVYAQIKERGLLSPRNECSTKKTKNFCEYHGENGHQIQHCQEFRQIVQELMNKQELQFYEERMSENERYIRASEENSRKAEKKLKKPVLVISKPNYEASSGSITSRVVIKTPAPFAYKSNKSVPWDYTCQINTPESKEEEVAEVGFFTRSGRCYAPGKADKARVVVIEDPDDKLNEPIKIEEAQEFLKFLKHNEYNIVEQLHKTPARISMLSLLLHSEVHRNTLIKVLNETFVGKDIPVERVDRMVNHINADNFIYFYDDEIPEEGKGRGKALHITAHCKGVIVSGVLIENGSALNVMPFATLNRLHVDVSQMRVCGNAVRAFDGTKHKIMGKMIIPLRIGPTTFEVEFVVMDIHPSYSCLLGRPWIHMAGAVPSSLHQKLRFIVDGTLVTIKAEEDIIASITTDAPYVGVDENALESSFQALEFVNATFISEGKRIPIPHLSKNTKMQLKETLARGAKVGKGLGKKLQGITEGLAPVPKRNYFGFRYKPTYHDKVRDAQKLKERRKARVKGEDLVWGPMVIPPLSKSFVSGGFVIDTLKQSWDSEDIEFVEDLLGSLSINVITNDSTGECSLASIRPCPPCYVLNNYTVEELPLFYKHSSKSSDINCSSNDTFEPQIDFENDMCLEESEGYKDKEECELNSELVRMMEQEDRQILPHKETTETINLGTEEDIKEEEMKKQFDAGFLQVAKYPEWVANIVPVPKKDGKVRMCVDYRDLNRASPKDNFPLPHIDTLVDNTAGHALFSFMDSFSGYNQIKMDPKDMEKTTFVTMWGTFCYKVIPFGLKNAGATYQRAMVTLFHDMMHKEIEVCVDDMIAKSQTEEEHVKVLRKLFLRLRKYQLKLNPAKCTFGATSGKLLGFVVSENGIEIDPDKVKAILELPPPRTQKEVRGFLGRLNYIARFISQLTEKYDPIFRLLRKQNPGEWDNSCQECFDRIKSYLINAPVLMPPIPNKPLILYLTVFEKSMGCVLAQHDETGRRERAIYYLSKKFTDCATRYSSIEKLCCVLVWTTKRLRQYLLYHTTWLISRLDPLKYPMESTALTGRMARWKMLLSEFDIVYMNQKSVKASAIADFLASRVLEDYEPVKFDFPNEDLMSIFVTEEDTSKNEAWKMNFDGASNAVGHGIGTILVSPEGDHYPFTSKLAFECTNNMAEYEECILGIQATIERKVKSLEVFDDSALIIYQLRGEWMTRDSKLIEYKNLVMELINEFEEISFTYLPREENQMADTLATLAAMFKAYDQSRMMPIRMSIKEMPAHCFNIEEEEDDGLPWYYDILQYVKYRAYPAEATENDKRTLRRLAMGYVLDGDILYKKGKDQVLLRCVDRIEAKKILEEVYEGVCGTHANGFTMVRKIMRFGYYWSTMEGDCIRFARRCHKCQIHDNQIHVPPSPLHVMNAPWPFSMWGIDVIGAISPKASNGHRFILVAIDYFTKWVEAASYANVTKGAVCRFLKREIICSYGTPEMIITDNALNLNNDLMKEVCTKLKIKHHNSPPYRPKMNGAVEAANKNIKKIITKATETYRDWHEKLPFALLAYRTSVRTSTGATPFSLVYGMEAVLPVEVEIPSLRVLMELKLDEADWKRMIRAYDKKVRPREFREGDLVLKKILPMQKDFRGKWMPNWEVSSPDHISPAEWKPCHLPSNNQPSPAEWNRVIIIPKDGQELFITYEQCHPPTRFPQQSGNRVNSDNQSSPAEWNRVILHLKDDQELVIADEQCRLQQQIISKLTIIP